MILGHPSENITRNTARKNQIQVICTMKECHECALAKIKQHKIAKETTTRSNVPGERLCIDISSVRSPSYGGAKFWLLIIDDASRMCWSTFLKHKSETGERVICFVKNLKENNYIVRCDNAGENQTI